MSPNLLRRLISSLEIPGNGKIPHFLVFCPVNIQCKIVMTPIKLLALSTMAMFPTNFPFASAISFLTLSWEFNHIFLDPMIVIIGVFASFVLNVSSFKIDEAGREGDKNQG